MNALKALIDRYAAGGAVLTDHHLPFPYGKRANLGTALQPRYTYATA